MELRTYGTTLGYCGLEDLDGTGEVEVGYGFAKQHWGAATPPKAVAPASPGASRT